MQLLPEGPGTHVGSDDAINRQGHLSDRINESDDQGEVIVIKVGGFGFFFLYRWFQFSSVQSLNCIQLCDPMDCSTPGLPVHHQLLE